MTLLACIDGSIYNDSVRDHAIWAAARLQTGVTFLHVTDGSPEVAPTREPVVAGTDRRNSLLRDLADIDARRSQLVQEHGRLLLADARVQAETAGVQPVSTQLRHGHLVEAVALHEAEADLIVLGKRGEHADFARLHLGSNLERVVRASPKPLLVASRGFNSIRQAVIAFDGAASSRKAVELASGGKLLKGVHVHIVSAGPETPELRAHINWARTLMEAREMPHVIEQVDGHPEQVIGEYVRRHDIDLLMMGAYGHTRVRDFIVGSTTTGMIRTCMIPVLLVR